MSITRNYKNGQQDGLHEIYHENGKLNSKQNFKNDVRHGLTEQFDQDGQLLKRIKFKKGIIQK